MGAQRKPITQVALSLKQPITTMPKIFKKKDKFPTNNLSNYDKKSDRIFLKTWRPHHNQWRYRKSRCM